MSGLFDFSDFHVDGFKDFETKQQQIFDTIDSITEQHAKKIIDEYSRQDATHEQIECAAKEVIPAIQKAVSKAAFEKSGLNSQLPESPLG
ncbi:MAG: hypothetical protein LUG19_10905 [Desulfovibrio sp.]|uniref:hypothetical protein n=1 Tax=Desulfovibrio sp. TaxID=885 RepID=UPI0025845A9A|nr:hypothetical protein [Desulfovibrio sp.]MCD7984738.1 hypothetical protein [Desulfovibrio sp.]